jgi:hypothetical protein
MLRRPHCFAKGAHTIATPGARKHPPYAWGSPALVMIQAAGKASAMRVLIWRESRSGDDRADYRHS